MFKKTLLGLGIILTAIFIFAAFKSPHLTVTRELAINATPEALFPYINNSQKSYEWMPWAEGDPSLTMQFSGPPEGVGTASNWKGKEMGMGSAEVIESVPNQVVKTKLIYTEPFKMEQLAEISLTPTENGTLVRWSVSGDYGFVFRLIGVFVDCDHMIGKEFEKGLRKLKALTEK